jgi:hypothetical protein
VPTGPGGPGTEREFALAKTLAAEQGGVAYRFALGCCLTFADMTVLICSIVLVSTFWAVAVACLLLTLALGRAGAADGPDGQPDH